MIRTHGTKMDASQSSPNTGFIASQSSSIIIKGSKCKLKNNEKIPWVKLIRSLLKYVLACRVNGKINPPIWMNVAKTIPIPKNISKSTIKNSSLQSTLSINNQMAIAKATQANTNCISSYIISFFVFVYLSSFDEVLS